MISPARRPSGEWSSTGLFETPRLTDLVLPLVAERGEGEKVDIPAIVRALTPTQAGIVAAIERLIAEGRLDPRTLRPPVEDAKEPKAAKKRGYHGDPDCPTGIALHARLMEAGRPLGLSATAVSKAVFGNDVQMFTMAKATLPVRRKTLEKAEAWLAGLAQAGDTPATEVGKADEPPNEGAAAESTPAAASEPVTPLQLKREIDAFCAEHRIPPSRFARIAMRDPKFVSTLAGRHSLRPTTAAKVRAFIANPDLRVFASSRGPKKPPPPRIAPEGIVVAPPKPAEPRADREQPRPIAPPEKAWCAQCDCLVSGARVEKCASPWCSFKRKAA